MIKKLIGALMLAVCLFFNPLISEAKSNYIIEGPVYLKFNIHYQDNGKDMKASYANYTNPGNGHKILRANTPVKVKSWRRKGFIIVNADTNEEIYFEYHEARMQMSAAEYLAKMTSKTKVNLSSLSEKDNKGIRDGRASVGMTKNGVMTALGYPATHRTPSLESDTWVYWTNRFGTIAIIFDKDGLVSRIQD